MFLDSEKQPHFLWVSPMWMTGPPQTANGEFEGTNILSSSKTLPVLFAWPQQLFHGDAIERIVTKGLSDGGIVILL